MDRESKVLVRCVLQKEDQIVICPHDWTIRRLKEHLSAVHPDTPPVDRQRLIYSGKCLTNDCLIGSVLRELPENTPYHVMHLVHTHLVEQRKQTEPQIRQRHVPTATVPQPTVTPSMPTQQQYPMYAYPGSQAQMPEDYLNMYNAYVANYMNYLQQYYGSMGVPATGVYPTAPVAAPAAQQAPLAQPNVVAPAPNANQQQAMNAAQVGIDDDEDDVRARDWLDWLYMCLRASLLITILYFYSSVERFALVIVCCFIMYAVQAGWFGRRRHRQQQNAPAAPPAPAAPEPAVEQEAEVAEPRAEPEATGEAAADPTPVVVEPSAWHVFWSTCYTFVTSFFASLVPEQAPPVNLN